MREKGLLLVCVMLILGMLVASDHEQKMKLDNPKSDQRDVIFRYSGDRAVQECLRRLARRERKKEPREKREPKAINYYAGDDEQ